MKRFYVETPTESRGRVYRTETARPVLLASFWIDCLQTIHQHRLRLSHPMKETSAKRIFLFSVSITLVFLFFTGEAGRAAEPKPNWQVEWEKALKAAEAEGEVTVYVVDYPRLTVSQFQKAYPRIKLNLVDGPSGPALSSRLMAERRAGKYQADLFITGQGIHVSVLYPAKGSGTHASRFYIAGSKRRVKVVQGKASFCRS